MSAGRLILSLNMREGVSDRQLALVGRFEPRAARDSLCALSAIASRCGLDAHRRGTIQSATVTDSSACSDDLSTQSGPARCRANRFTFGRRDRIPEGEDFVGAVRKGDRVSTEHLRLAFRPNGTARSRLGVSVGRKFAGAVARNRLKRLTREAFRNSALVRAAGLDVVVIAYGAAVLDRPREIVEGFARVVARSAASRRA
jgi:ribonuclease P protein component